MAAGPEDRLPGTPADAEARERDRWLDAAQKAGAVGCYHFDLLSGYWKSTPTLDEIFGIGPGFPRTLEGWLGIVAPADREAMADRYAAAAATGAAFDWEYRIRRAADGAERWVQGRGEFLRDENGGLVSIIGAVVDVTERKRAEEILRQSEEKFSRVFECAPLMVAISTLEEGRYIDVNRRFCETFGITREEAIGRSSVELGILREADRRRMYEAFLAAGRIRDIEAPVTTPDGRQIDCIFSAEPLTVGGRRLLLSTALDISGRKRIEKALQESEERFSLFMDNLPAAAFIKDPEGRTLMANRYLCDLAGGIEMEGRTTRELFPPEIAERMIEDDRRALAAGLTVVEEEVPDASGRRRHFQTIKFPVPVGEGRAVLGGVAIEITARREAEEALRTQERILRSVIEANPESIFLLGLDGTVLMCNRTFAERHGRTPEEIVGTNARELLPPELARERFAWIERVVRSGQPVVFEDVRNGRHMESRIYPVFGPDGRVEKVAVLGIDITERVRMQDQLIRTQKLESLGLLAGGIAHDFNNILTAILGNLSFARRLVGPGHRAAARLQECEKATVHAGELTRQLLTFARGGEPVREALDTGALLSEIVAFALHGSNVRGIVDLAPGLWRLDADRGQVGQLLNNLLLNARQAMPRGGTVSVRAENEEVTEGCGGTLRPGPYVSISVRDTGTGIPREHIGRIFDPYFTTKAEGSGLGLTSAHSIARRHGGSIEVESRPGEGTEFVVRLPATESEPPPVTKPARGSAGGSGRVLLMDDESSITGLAEAILAELGYEAVTCRDGAEAVERYRAAREAGRPFRAAILDLTVPGGMGGKEAAARILEIDPGALLVVSSGYSNDPVLADPAGHGFRGSVSKPYSFDTLAAELARLMEP